MDREGLVHIYTGDGKGKTTAAVGLAVRAAGCGLRVVFAQFLKGRPTGELEPLRRLGVTVLRGEKVTKFVPYMTPEEREACRAAQLSTFNEAKGMAGEADLLVLDEVFGAISTGMLEENDVAGFIKDRPQGLELVLTGRGAPESIASLADYISDLRAVKHPYERGIAARRGIEY